MRKDAGFRAGERGSAFFVVILFAIVSTALVGAYLTTSLGKARHVEQQVADRSAFNAAESGLSAVVEELWTTYRQASPMDRLGVLDPLDGKNDPADRFVISDRSVGMSSFDAEVRKVRLHGSQYADVEIVAKGRNRYALRTLTAVVRYGRKPSEVFNHAYFINNFGWLWGSTITVNGSVRSNGNFSLRGATVNGDIVGSENEEIGAAGTVTGDSSHLSLDDYNATAGPQIRPTDPSAPPEDVNGNGILDPGEDRNGNGRLDDFAYEGGYDGESDRLEHQKVVEMPYLGDLSVYRELAATRGGTITQGTTTLVAGTLGDETTEPRNIILVGTEENPLVINGPVVVEGDVVIKGVVTGRGTIYAGRNVHIVGNLTYQAPPSWPKPMEDKEAVKAANAAKDLIGLAAKGSVIFGDYTRSTWKSDTNYYQRPPFTQPYTVDPTDAGNGYVSYHDSDGNAVFNGDYTATDGGTKPTDDGLGTIPRRFFESSFSDAQIHEVADAGYVTHIDAVLYTNHLLSGRIGACTFNGSLVSRDEAIIYSTEVEMNHDPRIRDDGYEFMDIYLPREPTYRILYWSEGRPLADTTTAVTE